ncbi:transglycosylase domain-containing protein [Lacticaseibacillus saniviri]|nr:transglycosylase domain-containing protein [Lacticaseibacillus saniviri]
MAVSSIISLSLIGLILVGLIGGGTFAYFKYGDSVKASIRAGYKVADGIHEADFHATKPTTVYGQNSQVLKEFKKAQYRYLTYKEMKPDIYHALIAIEDQRFYEHHGVDIQGLVSVAGNYVLSRDKRGASTITQQLIKNVYLSSEQTLNRKVTEMVAAQALEQKFSKQQILEFYLNNVNYGRGAAGINTAAYMYLGKSINDANLLETATLIGVTNNPAALDPITHTDAAVARGKVILKAMYDQKYISSSRYHAALNETFKPDYHPNNVDNTVNDNQIAVALSSATEDIMRANHFKFQYIFPDQQTQTAYQSHYSAVYKKTYQHLLAGGYSLYTNIDPKLQQSMQQIVTQAMAGYTAKNPQTGNFTKQASMTVIDNKTGQVVASIGGRGEATNKTYNRAILSLRQPGSSIKPYLAYAPAFDSGMLETDKMSDKRPNNNYPNNFGNISYGTITLKKAVAVSDNVIAYKLALKQPDITAPLTKMRFIGLDYRDNNPIISVGGFTRGVSNQDMTAAVATLVNHGNYREPTNVNKLVQHNDSTDQTLYDHADDAATKVFRDDGAYLTLDAMKSVLTDPQGTGAAAKVPGYRYVAGKTGTTDDRKDFWFTGATPYYSIAVWIGDDTPSAQGQEIATVTQQIFSQAMKQLVANKPVVDFERPSSVRVVKNQLISQASDQAKQLATRQRQNAAVIAEQKTWLANHFESLQYKISAGLTLSAEEQREQQVLADIDAMTAFQLKAGPTTDNWDVFKTYYYQQALDDLSRVKRTSNYNSLHERIIAVYASQETALDKLKDEVARQAAKEDADAATPSDTDDTDINRDTGTTTSASSSSRSSDQEASSSSESSSTTDESSSSDDNAANSSSANNSESSSSDTENN